MRPKEVENKCANMKEWLWHFIARCRFLIVSLGMWRFCFSLQLGNSKGTFSPPVLPSVHWKLLLLRAAVLWLLGVMSSWGPNTARATRSHRRCVNNVPTLQAEPDWHSQLTDVHHHLRGVGDVKRHKTGIKLTRRAYYPSHLWFMMFSLTWGSVFLCSGIFRSCHLCLFCCMTV